MTAHHLPKRSWNRLKDLYFIWILRRYWRRWRQEILRREQKGQTLGLWLYLINQLVIKQTRYLTPANILSLCRGLLAYPIYLLLMEGYTAAALLVFIVGLLTDFFDGHLARAFDQETTCGKLIDPLFDKIMIASTAIALMNLQIIPIWLTAVIVILDACLVVMAIILKPLAAYLGIKRVAGANDYGKWKMACQAITILLSYLSLLFGPTSEMGMILQGAAIIFGVTASLLAVGSIVEHAHPQSLGGSPEMLIKIISKKISL